MIRFRLLLRRLFGPLCGVRVRASGVLRSHPAMEMAAFACAVMCLLFLLVVVGLHKTNATARVAAGAAAAAKNATDRIANDEKTSCQIQSRGLPASHTLTRIFAEVQPLFVPRPGENAQLPPYLQKDITMLKADIATYVRIEEGQPFHRSC